MQNIRCKLNLHNVLYCEFLRQINSELIWLNSRDNDVMAVLVQASFTLRRKVMT
jgi:hypothetical protein